MLLAFILCFSTLPMTAFAQETDAVAEQEEQQEADTAEEQEEQQEADSAEGQEEQQEVVPVTQKEAEAAAAPGEETSSDKSPTAGEAPDTVEPAVESVSDSDAGTQNTGADDEKKAAVQKVQALIDALPETVTEENAERVSEQLEAIDEAMAELTEEQREELNMTRLHAISEALNTPMTVPMTVAEGKHTDHPICGVTCTDENKHSIVTEWKPIDSEAALQAATEGYYYLTQDIVITETWKPKSNVVLCLNGHSIAANGNFAVIEIKGANRQFTLCDCNSSASTHYFIKSVENNFTRWVPCEENTENRISVTGGVITHSVRTSDLGVEVDNNATFTMYGGTICGHEQPHSYYGAGVYVHDSTFNMYGGAISGNAASWCGGVAALGSTFNMYGGVISDNMVSAGGGGVLLSDKSVMNMSGNAQIRDNIALAESQASGGGVYIYADYEGEGNRLIMSDDAKISGNKAASGGAVYVGKNGQVTMSGNAQITNNTATENGGGVYVENSTFKIAGGAPRVCDNLCQDVQNNVYLASGNAIRISKLSKFTGKIGVSTQDTPTENNLVTVAAVAVEAGSGGHLTEEDLDHICSDKENLYPVLVGGNVKLSATEPHRHPVCGAACGDSENHGNLTWIGVSNLTEIKSGGYYYLTDNVKLNGTWTCTNDVALCLNGKTITCAAEADAIKVTKGTKLIITDCQEVAGKITHAQYKTGRGIMSLGTLMLYNGEITNNEIVKGNGAGVHVDGGEFYMYNGSISNNKVSDSGNGGGVYAIDSTNFVISGGSIDSNHAPSSGGGIYYESKINKSVNFTISGGNIVRNSAVTGNGGGICLKSALGNMKFTMSGGRISNNVAYKNGGGVYISENYYGKFTVSGAAQITDNAKDNNVYLPSRKTIFIGAKGLDSSAKIGVTMEQQLAEGVRVAIAKGTSDDYTLTADDLNAFNSDTGYYKYALDNAVNFSSGELHVHGLCGTANCTESKNHKNVLWTAIRTEEELRDIQGGSNSSNRQYYYLTNNIVLNNTSWNPTGYISLCLNGYSITANGNFDTITVGEGKHGDSLTLCDCNGSGNNTGEITHVDGMKGRGVYLKPFSDLSLYSGNITGNNTDANNTDANGGGVYLTGGSFYMYGGSITENSASYGGGVAGCVGKSDEAKLVGCFWMLGGSIKDNNATADGGGVAMDDCDFDMRGGSIIGNRANANGGGVAVQGTHDVEWSGGHVTGNTAKVKGGGVYVAGSVKIMKVSGDVNITSNTNGNVYLPGGKTITVGSSNGYTVKNLTDGANIGVTLEKLPAAGDFMKFAEAATGITLTDEIAGKFTIDNNSSNTYSVQNIDNSLYVVNGALHEHAICGSADCSHKTKHDDVLWTPLTYNADTQEMMCGGTEVSSNKLSNGNIEYKLTAGNYYLPDNITFAGTIIISGNVNFCLNGRSITNSPQYFAWTFEVPTGGKLTLCDHEGGTITSANKNQQNSNGVWLYAHADGDPATFTMYGGTITGNQTGVYGNNAFVPGVFNMYGGVITGNKTGASIPAEITMTVGGTARIIDNTEINVYLYEEDKNSNSKSIIHIDPSLTDDASVGVTTDDNILTAEAPVQIATGATGSVKYTEIFKADWKDQGGLVTKDAQGDLYLSAHQHSWEYKLDADGKTITATCVNTTNCPNADGGSVTINAPEERTYNGSGKAAKVTASDGWLGMAVDKITISYKDAEGNLLSEAPTDAGTYWASITIGNRTADVQYTINSKKVTDPTIEVADAGTYDGKAKTPSVTVKDGGTVIPSDEYSVSYENNTNAGTATVKITDVAGGNYIVNGSQTFKIDQATITVTPTTGQNKIYGTDDPKLKYNVSGAENNETPAFSGALSRADGTDVGEYKITQGTLKLTDGDGFTATNYRLKFTNDVKFNITPRPVTITGVSAQNKIYDGSAATEITGTAVINGLAAGDKEDVEVDARMAHATFENANAGTAKTVNFSGYALTGAKARNYTLSAQPGSVTADINPKELTITDVTVADKTYNGTTEAVITGVSFNGLVNGDSLTKDTDYTVTGTFKNPAAGTDKAVTAAVKLADSVKNYILRNTEYTKNGCKISKAVLAAPADRDFTICNDAKTTYTVMLSTLLPSLESPREYGNLTYDDPKLTITDSSYEGTATVRRSEYEYGKLALTINATGETEDYIGTITVKVQTDNYEDITLSFNIKATAKTVPQLDGPLTIDPAEITYGKKLGDIKISGTMKDGTEVVRGQFTWVTPDQVLPAGDQSVMWKFTPNFNVQYAEVTGYTTIKVHKIILTGAPDYVVITESGKKLSDAVLTVDNKWPAGTLEWIDDAGNVLPGNTTVEVNTTFKWRFTPADTNYETLTGSIELYHVDAPKVTVQPKSVSVTVGDTATFEVAATGTDVTYQWQIDRNNGNGFVNITGATGETYTTGVTDRACNGFKYRCVLSNAADSVITDTVVLTVQYQIIEGANGSWNQNTDGGSLRIRGNGEFSKFQNVKVDGNIVDSKNYTASEGSTIIELHADYLKTLSEGSHIFEIVWTDGAAVTGFTVARNTSGSNNTGSNNDNNDSTDNSAAAAPTAAAPAQELDKVPATGDPFGIWLTLFAISLTGLSVMLARRKKG